MKKIILCLVLIVLCVSPSIAQMSDSQILNYVKSESAKGISQQQIAINLMQRGATEEQLQRIKSQIEKEQPTSTVTSESKDKIVRNYVVDTVSNEEQPLLAKKSNIYGRDIFNQKKLTFNPDVNIPTPVDYKLGAGDEVVIDIWGASQATMREIISPEGTIRITNLGPISLSGMTIEEANRFVQQKLSSIYSGVDEYSGASQIKLTLGQIRTIQINVMGEVSTPGTYSTSSLSSVFHALYRAGGVSDIGSLRTIQVYRKGKLITTVDIYKYLFEGKSDSDIRLFDGDIIIVPPYVSMVNISGKVKRPMFYEMKERETLNDILKYSGGFASDGYTEKIYLSRTSGGYNKAYTIASENFSQFILNDGDSISIKSGLNLFDNRVEIKGAVYRPGYYELGKNINTVKELVDAASGLKGNAFTNRAIITREKDDLTTETIALNLKTLLEGSTADIQLKKNDVLFIASDSILIDLGDVTIHGDVTNPGKYSYAEHMSIEDLIIQAGGLLNSASIAKVDVARRLVDPLSTISSSEISKIFTFNIKNGLIVDGSPEFELKPYDQIYIRRSPGYQEQRNIMISGEVLFPGTYALQEKTERLSEIIKKAGSLTGHAFPQGARLIRQKTKDEILRQQSMIDMIKRGGMNDSISMNSMDIDPYYNIGIELDKAIANPKSEYDLVLRAGDKIIIPEYDNTVKINGAVMYPNTVLYKRGENLSYYIEQAGGFTDLAKKKNAYIVYTNGTVAKAKKHNNAAIQPGCEIIIPSKERSAKMSLAEKISIGTSITSMASVVALLINALTK